MEFEDAQMVSWVRRMCEAGEARRIRADALLHQSDVARYLDVSAAAVSTWESGRRLPRSGIALRYARLLEGLIEGSLEADSEAEARPPAEQIRRGPRSHVWGPRDQTPWPPQAPMTSREFSAYREMRQFLRVNAEHLGWTS